ncbi:MAG: DUF3794 domain-containing protein [Bacillota bacterium]|nr:DUF3794 domain-containing protein [Bacillota bacterium]
MKQNHELLEMTQMVPAVTAQASIEGAMTVPEGMPDMASVLSVEARAQIESAEPVENGVMMEGEAEFTIIYTDAENEPYSFTMTTGFKHSMQMPGAKPGMDADVDARITELSYTLKDGRTISSQAVVEIEVSMQSEEQESVLSSAADEALQVQTRRVQVPGKCCTASAVHLARDDAAIPQGEPRARRVLFCGGIARVLASVFEQGKLIVRGTLRVTIIYATGEKRRPIVQFVHNIPFEHMLTMEGCRECARKRVRARVRDSDCRIEDEGRVLRIESTVFINGRCCNLLLAETIVDAYSTKQKIGLDTVDMSWQSEAAEADGRLSMREAAPVPENMPAMGELLFVSARPVVTAGKAMENSVSVEGLVQCRIIYTSDEGKMASYAVDAPFVINMTAEGAGEGMGVAAEVVVEQAGVGPSGELRIELSCHATVTKEEKETAVSAIRDEGLLEAASGIAVHFAGESDTFWSVAKEYAVTMEQLMDTNPQLSEGRFSSGQKVTIFKPYER